MDLGVPNTSVSEFISFHGFVSRECRRVRLSFGECKLNLMGEGTPS